VSAALPGAVSFHELLKRVGGGDNGALEIIYEQRGGLVRRLIAAEGVPSHDVEDVAQKVWMQLWMAAGDLANRENVTIGFLVTMAKRRAIDQVRKNARSPVAFSLSGKKDKRDGGTVSAPGEYDVPDEKDDPFDVTFKNELHEALEVAGRVLNEVEKEVFMLHHIMGWKFSEIAAELKITENMARKRCHNARRKMAKALKDEGITLE